MNDWNYSDIKFDQVYTPTQARRHFGISKVTIYRWIKNGRLICISTAKKTKFTGQRLYEAALNAKGL